MSKLLLPSIPVQDYPIANHGYFDAKQWSKGRQRLYIEREDEAMQIWFWARFDRSIWEHLGKIQQVGAYIGLFYESWVRKILTTHPEVSTIKKVTSIQWMTTQLLEENDMMDFHHCLPDLLVELASGGIAFLEIKASAPWHGPVIYRDAFEGYEKYQALGIPIFFVFIEHPVEESQRKFNAWAVSKRNLYNALRTPNSVHVVPASMIESLYHAVPAAEIDDKRRGRMFKRLRMNQIRHAAQLYRESRQAEVITMHTALCAKTLLAA